MADDPFSIMRPNVIAFRSRMHENPRIKHRGHMRQILSLAMTLVMVNEFAPATFASEPVKSQITRMPTGANIEIQLKSKQKLRGREERRRIPALRSWSRAPETIR